MLPRLAAEERLNAINDRAVATGALKKQDARQMIQRLERAAKDGRRAPAAKANPAALATMGIGVAFDGESLMAAPSQSNRGAADG